MEVSYSQPVMVGGMLAFPETAFANQPIVVQAVTVQTGGATSTVVNVTGTVGGVVNPIDIPTAP